MAYELRLMKLPIFQIDAFAELLFRATPRLFARWTIGCPTGLSVTGFSSLAELWCIWKEGYNYDGQWPAAVT